MEDIQTITGFVHQVRLEGKEDLLQDAEARWRLEQTLERAKARQCLLENAFSRHVVNARFHQDEHHVLMHQQSW